MSPLFVFATSKSGHVSPPEGASLGWMAGAVAGTAAIFGMASPAAADPECPHPPYTSYCGYTTCTAETCSQGSGYQVRYVCKIDGQTCNSLGGNAGCC
jgi:hypothetical protein